jgi:hypothetical protein
MTTGTTSIATSSTRPAEKRLPADVARGHADQTVTGDLLGESDAGLDRAGGMERRVGEPGEPFLGQRPVGDDDERVPGGRYTGPAVGGVEQVAADHRDLDGVPERFTYSAEARLTLNAHFSLAWTVQSPLPYQSNSGPTVSSG